MRRMGPRKRASKPSGGGSTFMTVDGDLVNRCEVFDEADLDAALARFDQLSRPAPRLENAASQVYRALLGALRGPRLGCAWRRYWPTTFCVDDRRRVVNAGIRHGRDAEIANLRAVADVGVTTIDVRSSSRPAGERLVLARVSAGERRVRGSSSTRCWASSRSTPTIRSRRSSCSTSTTSTPPSRSSTPATSPAKRPPTRARGRSSRGPTPRSTGTNFPR